MKKMTFEEAKLVVQLEAPLHIGSGEPEAGSDSGIVRDFNGLPAIPGASLQGVIRNSVPALKADALFGKAGKDGRGGRLWVSWGAIHDSNDNPVCSRMLPSARDDDPVLREASRSLARDHVRLNRQGVADGRGKFDEISVSAGHRFTFQLRFETAGKERVRDWLYIQKTLRKGQIRLGGKTRRGFGRLRVCSLTVGPAACEIRLSRPATTCIELTPLEPWLFGGGSSEVADASPLRGSRIEWGAEGGMVVPVWIIPGASIKGVLRHRTLFHACIQQRHFADKQDPQGLAKAEAIVEGLFGSDGERPSAGRVNIDDVMIDCADWKRTSIQQHVAINPFTAGAIPAALFNDHPLSKAGARDSIELRIEVSGSKPPAFEMALSDLMEGRLPLGAYASRGYGAMKGSQKTV